MLVSVAIPAHNQANYLREAIESAIAQTYRPLEIIVVDDGSTDHTAEVCLAYKEVNYIYQRKDATKGSGARNRAIREAKGEWIALLDQDDLWLPIKIEKQVEIVNTRPGLGAVFTQTNFIDSSGRELRDDPVRGKSGQLFHGLLWGNWFRASSGMFRKAALDVCGYPDEDTVGDWDLWLRIARHWEIYTIDESLTRYRIHDGGFSRNLGEMSDRESLLRTRQKTRLHDGCAECRGWWETLLKQRWLYHLNSFHTEIIERNNRAARQHLVQALKLTPGMLFRSGNLYRIARRLASALIRRVWIFR
jgi:glycosyltransferase involved in cell wall biosynthesis